MIDDDNLRRYNAGQYFEQNVYLFEKQAAGQVEASPQQEQGLAHDMNHVEVGLDVDDDDKLVLVAQQLEMQKYMQIPQRLAQVKLKVWVRPQIHEDDQKMYNKDETKKM